MSFQNQLLNFLESGHIPGAKIFATTNEVKRLSKPLQSRFRKLYLPKYSREQFLNVAVKVCPKLPKDIAMMIGEEVFKINGSIRDEISIGKLLKNDDGSKQIRHILTMLERYGKQY